MRKARVSTTNFLAPRKEEHVVTELNQQAPPWLRLEFNAQPLKWGCVRRNHENKGCLAKPFETTDEVKAQTPQEEADMDERKPRTKKDKLIASIAATLTGKSASPVVVKARLEGPAADTWKGLQEASKDLGLNDADLLALLLRHGGSNLLVALRNIPRE